MASTCIRREVRVNDLDNYLCHFALAIREQTEELFSRGMP